MKYVIDSDTLTGIADAIRHKTDTPADIRCSQFADQIEGIQTGITPSGSVTLAEEGSYDVTDKATAVVDMSATRANLAEAVTAKGVDTLPTSSFDTIATNIGLIEGGGGGGSVLDDILGAPTLLYTATVTEPVHAINIPVGDGWKTDYDYLLFAFDLDFSANDWLYMCADIYKTSGVGQLYFVKGTNIKAPYGWVYYKSPIDGTAISPSRAGNGTDKVNPTTQWVFQMYTASVSITNGTIKVYGGNY